MATQLKTLGAWAQTRNTLVQDLTMSMQILQSAPFSDDPDSVFQKAKATDDRVLDTLRQHAVLGIEQIDDAIAAGPLVGQINALSKAAKKEADRIQAIAHTIDDIAGAVDKVTGVVTKFAALPFVGGAG
jgi:hypothetical protein